MVHTKPTASTGNTTVWQVMIRSGKESDGRKKIRLSNWQLAIGTQSADALGLKLCDGMVDWKLALLVQFYTIEMS